MADDAKHLDDNAIAAFSKALEIDRGHLKAKFQRGQIYFRKGSYAEAKRDLEDVMKTGDAWSKQIAGQLLMQIAAKKK